jgi:F-box/leucine-rich repeat protein 2/20
MELSMGNCKNVYEDCIQQISRTCSQLVSLDISNIKDISDSTVKNIASKCPNLTTLKLSFCNQITDSSIKSLAKQVGKHLIELDLTSCVHLTDQSILSIAKVASKMRRLVLRQCSEITGAAMLELAKNCSELEKLDISNCHRIDTIIEVLFSCSKLSELNMESCFGLGFDCLKNLNKKLPALVNFNWSQGNASNESLKVVAMCMPNVETLQFNYCKKVTDQGVQYLANLHNVRELYLDNTSITDAAIKSLAEGGSANSISVLSLQNPEKLTDESLEMMTKQFKVLKHLSISSNDLTDQAIEKLLLGCRELHELFIKNNILSKKAVHGLRDKFPNVKLLVHTTLNM